MNGRVVRQSSTEQQSDAALLLRAGIVQRALLGADLPAVASWRVARANLERIARAAADGGDTIDGVLVTLDGATSGALPPVGGAWPAGSGSGRSLLVLAPRHHPTTASITEYDAARRAGVHGF